MRLPLIVAAAATAATACGLGLTDDPSGGGANLPTLGAGPYGKLELDFETAADEPYVVADRNADLRDPAALRRADGGFRLWFTRIPADATATSEIWTAELADLHELPDVAPAVALPADADWEAGRVAAPSILPLADGTLAMFYEAGDPPAIGRADSDDDGATWRKQAGNPVLAGAARPSAIELPDGRWQLFYVRPDAAGIFRADSADGVTFTAGAAPILTARGGIEAFDRSALGDPAALAGLTEAGQLRWGLFYTGAGEDDVVAIGYAGSFDGDLWRRFAGLDAVLEAGPPSELGPCAVLEPTRAFLFFHERRSGHDRIAAAVHP